MLGLCKFPAINAANRTIFLRFLRASAATSDWNNIAVMMQWPNAWVDLRFLSALENVFSRFFQHVQRTVHLHKNCRSIEKEFKLS